MKITLNNVAMTLPGLVIADQLQPRITEALAQYKEWPMQKRLMVKTGIRTMQAFLEMQIGMRVQFPENDDFIVMLLENLPQWIEQITERIELDATTISDTTGYQTITGLSIKLSH